VKRGKEVSGRIYFIPPQFNFREETGGFIMAQLFIRHKVKDYAKWKPLFDEHGAKRKAAGSKGGRLFRSEKDPNEVVILFD
jgi:hypothetical protein